MSSSIGMKPCRNKISYMNNLKVQPMFFINDFLALFIHIPVVP